MDGRRLIDAVGNDRAGWIGPKYDGGSGIPVLAKLLDSGQRLPVHVHPNEDFAQRYLSSSFGKTEAWLVLHAEPEAMAYVGWRHDIDRRRLMEQIGAQDAKAMLEAMNAIPLKRGDTVLIPGGTVHAFDSGVLIAEVEEPTDLSLLFEYASFDVSEQRATLGLSWELVLQASNLRATTRRQLDDLLGHVDLTLNQDRLIRTTPSCAESYFVGWVASVRDVLTGLPSLTIGIVVSGGGQARCRHGSTNLRAGDTFVVPFSCGPWELHGRAVVALYEPPALAPG